MHGTTTTNSETTLSSSFYTDFIPVTRKKRKSKAQREKEPLLNIIQRVRNELIHDDWLSQCQQIIIETLAGVALPEEVLCLGLGSPSSSPNARAQLAFLLAICEHLNIAQSKVSLYDPVFTAEDHALFGTLQMNTLSEYKEPDEGHTLHRPTLCFMPHCDIELYESIIKANWSRRRLPYLRLVANRLMDYVDSLDIAAGLSCDYPASTPRHKLETTAPLVLALAPVLECRPLPSSRQWPTAFNSIAVQAYSETGTLNLPDE